MCLAIGNIICGILCGCVHVLCPRCMYECMWCACASACQCCIPYVIVCATRLAWTLAAQLGSVCMGLYIFGLFPQNERVPMLIQLASQHHAACLWRTEHGAVGLRKKTITTVQHWATPEMEAPAGGRISASSSADHPDSGTASDAPCSSQSWIQCLQNSEALPSSHPTWYNWRGLAAVPLPVAALQESM